MSHEILVLQGGRCVEHGPAAEVFDEPRHEYTRTLLAAAFALEAVGNAEASA